MIRCSLFAVRFANVFDLQGDALKNDLGVQEVQAPFRQSPFSL
jgi:hypothetical protein